MLSYSGQGEVEPQQRVPQGPSFGDTGPPVAQMLPPVQAASLPHLHVFVDGSHHSPASQQAPPPAVQSC
jgi:hypothetical protein